MGTTALPSTLGPFDWNVMRSGTDRYWTLAWAMLAEQRARLAADEIVPRDRFGEEGSLWTPAVDLSLSEPTTFTWFDEGVFVPARRIVAIAAAGVPERLCRGEVLRLEAVRVDRYWEGMGTNFWSVDGGRLGVGFIHSALEGRWGGAAVLADGLIVPVGHPIVGDAARADRLVADLQTITRAFRAANGLPADGEAASNGPA
jgi:hypothetical protein